MGFALHQMLFVKYKDINCMRHILQSMLFQSLEEFSSWNWFKSKTIYRKNCNTVESNRISQRRLCPINNALSCQNIFSHAHTHTHPYTYTYTHLQLHTHTHGHNKYITCWIQGSVSTLNLFYGCTIYNIFSFFKWNRIKIYTLYTEERKRVKHFKEQ